MKKRTDFTNAQEMRLKHPETFHAPSKEDLDNLKPNNFIKIGVCGERFWVQVKEVNGNEIKGVVDNDLIHSDEHGYYCNDTINVQKQHVMNILE
jgi:hypothetical protein